MYEYILHGFYNANLNSPLKQMYGENDQEWLDVPIHFIKKGNSFNEIIEHLQDFTFSRGVYTFIIEVKND